MIVLDIDCSRIESNVCHDSILLSYPNAIGISHIKNNHIICVNTDYNTKGQIDENIHTLCRQLGGGERQINNKTVKEKPINTNPFYNKVLQKISLQVD